MQGHRSVIGSLPEDIGHGSSSNNPAIDTQSYWGNMMNPGELDIQDYLLPPGDAGYEGPNLSKWNLGESSSSTRPNEVSKQDERKSEHGWSSLLTASAGIGPRLQDWQHDPNLMFYLNNGNVNSNANQILNGPLFMQSSTSDGTPPNLNLNAGFVGHVEDDCLVVEYPNAYKSSESMSRQVAPANCSSDPFGIPSGSDVRPEGSVEGRSSHKRKAIDGNVGQSSVTGSSRYFHRAENISWQPVTSRPVAARSLTISTPSNEVAGPNTLENANPQLGLNLRAAGSGSHQDSTIATSQRNLRLRMSSPAPQESVPLNFVPSGSTYRSLNQQMVKIPPVNHSIELGQTLAIDNTTHQNQPAVLHLHALPQQVQSARSNVSSSPRHGTSTTSIIPGERMAAHHEEGSLRNLPRHIMEHPLFQPTTELRSVTRSSVQRTLTSGNTNTSTHRNGVSSTRNVPSRNVPSSTPRSGSSSSGHPSYAHPWVPHRSSSHTQRLSEHARHALLSANGSDSGGLAGSHPPLQSGASTSSLEAMLSLNHRNPRSWEGQSDGSLGIRSLQSLAAAGEGRSRLVSEIRSVLDNMRRGEGLRIEDYMLLDQSMLFGVADAHDRHRDMRLDVDNMSYEELLALEERIGDVNTGLKEETILNGLKQLKYFSISIEPMSEDEPCSICREEYQDGEDLGVLSCGHDFHTPCIKQWLGMKNLCPICKTTAINEKKT